MFKLSLQLGFIKLSLHFEWEKVLFLISLNNLAALIGNSFASLAVVKRLQVKGKVIKNN